MHLPREDSLLDVEHPAFIHGPGGILATPRRVVGLGTDLHELADRIKNGDPSCGWEGDPRLTLARYDDGRAARFELWRLGSDGEYHLVCVLDGNLDPSGICRRLVERDARRGFDLHEFITRHNAKVTATAVAPAQEKLGAASEKLAWALRKDNGIRTHWSMSRKVGA